MKLTKDEARILSAALCDHKYEFYERIKNSSDYKSVVLAVEDLEKRLEMAGKDERRQGRTSMNDFADCMRRFARTFAAKQK